MKRVFLIGLGFLASTITSNFTAHADCTPPPTGLVAWWPGEGSAIDVSGSNNGVFVGSISYALGKVGEGFNFDGVSGAVQIPDNSMLNFTNELTIEFWYKDMGSVKEYGLVTKRPPFVGACNFGVNVLLGTSQTLQVFFEESNSGTFQISAVPVPMAGAFHHVAATYKQVTATQVEVQTFIDGQLVKTAALSGNLANTVNSQPVSIGCDSLDHDNLNGEMDEVSLYNRVLSTNEIAAIYNAGSAGKCALVATTSVPQIFHVSPAIATNGAIVTLDGTNFNTIAASNIVNFGAVQATVLSGNVTNLVVTVPIGTTLAPVTVTVGGLTAYSSQFFEPTFLGSGPLSLTSLAERVDLPGGSGPCQVAFGDLDGDGKPDMAAANTYDGSIWIYRNVSSNGVLTTGSLAPAAIFTIGGGIDSVKGLALADLNGDGRLDVIAANRNLNIVSIFQNLSSPGNLTTNSFAARVDLPVAGTPQNVAVTDLDGDGRPEIVTANDTSKTVSVLLNLGLPGSITTNSFEAPVNFLIGVRPVGLAIGDIDGDNKPDLITANWSSLNAVSVLRNTSTVGNISFSTVVNFAGLDENGSVAIGDLDGDGKMDLICGSESSGQAVSVYRNTSTAGSINTNSLAPHVDFAVGGWANSVAIGDLDGDGKLDIVAVTQLPDHMSVFRNISTVGNLTTSSFASRVDYAAGSNPNGIAIGDLDGDGRPDIAFGVAYAATVSLYQNQTPFNGPPAITTQPESRTVLAGTNVVLSVAASGIAPLTYQWSFNGTNILGATNDTLTLANLHVSQTGNYRVSVANAYGTATSADATITVIGQDILIYNYSGKEQVTTLEQEFSYSYSGQMFFLPTGTNGAFVGWATLNGKKQYWVSPLAGYLWITIPGSTGHVYTVLGHAGDGLDESGAPHLWSYLHRGLNSSLNIATKRKFSFPWTFTCNDTHVYPDMKTGNMVLREATSTYQFVPTSTQTANNTGQTLFDLVKILTKSLEKHGYQLQ